MHTADHPAFADTELASNVSLFPLVGLTRGATSSSPEPRPSVDPTTDLFFSYTPDPERVRHERALRLRATREAERRRTDVGLRIAAASKAAYADGKAAGHAERERQGWAAAVSWGIFVGAFGTCLLGAIVVMGLVLHIGRSVPLF